MQLTSLRTYYLHTLITMFVVLALLIFGSLKDLFLIPTLSVMLVFAFVSIYNGSKCTNNFILSLIFAMFAFIHYCVTSTESLSLSLLLVNGLIIINSDSLKVNFEFLSTILLLLIIISSSLYTSEILSALLSSDKYVAYKGFFTNPNTTGAFICLSAFAFPYIRNSKWRYLILLLVLIIAYATKSRNALLFFFYIPIFYYIIQRLNNKIVFLSHLLLCLIGIFIMYVFYDILEDPTTLSLMGKGGSAGRATQVYLGFDLYSLNLFGHGRGVVNTEIYNLTGYPIHNYFATSILEFGMILFGFYFITCYGKYNKLSIYNKSLMLSFHTYFFFEPGSIFSLNMINLLPLILLILTIKTTTIVGNRT